MVVLNKKAIAVRDRMYRHMEVMAPELKEPLTDEEYYKILNDRVDRIMYELIHGERRPW